MGPFQLSPQVAFMFYVMQSQEDSEREPLILCSCPTRDAAEDERDRVNANLGAAGIPSWVSSAYVDT